MRSTVSPTSIAFTFPRSLRANAGGMLLAALLLGCSGESTPSGSGAIVPGSETTEPVDPPETDTTEPTDTSRPTATDTASATDTGVPPAACVVLSDGSCVTCGRDAALAL